ncbi:MAG TPA: type II toxin-antitoxin system death-on-curing family toxin [Pantanalinema sp.]
MSESPVYLEVDEVEGLHSRLLELHGGVPGVKSLSLLESAVNRPRFKAHYEGVVTQAGALMFGLAKNHAFNDGNKRIAAVATDVLLQENGREIVCDNDTLASFLERCSEPDWTEEAVVAFLRENVRLLAG